MRKAQEFKRFASRCTTLQAQLTDELSELDEAGLLLVERKLEFRQTLLEMDQICCASASYRKPITKSSQ
jgi:hypothetical protein